MEKLNELISALTLMISQVKDFAVDQMPDIAQQIVAKGMAGNLMDVYMYSVLALVLALASALLLWLSIAGFKRRWANLPVFSSVLLCVVSFCVLGFGSDAYKSYKKYYLIKTAPKVYLIEYVKDLASNNNIKEN